MYTRSEGPSACWTSERRYHIQHPLLEEMISAKPEGLTSGSCGKEAKEQSRSFIKSLRPGLQPGSRKPTSRGGRLVRPAGQAAGKQPHLPPRPMLSGATRGRFKPGLASTGLTCCSAGALPQVAVENISAYFKKLK